MKAVMLMFDSLNRNCLPPYGCDWVHAPNFQRLAEKTVTFDNSFVGSMPCMPARRELHTGRYNFLHRSWGPIEPFDDSMPEILSKNGIYTHLVTDHFHYFQEGGATYHTRFVSWEYNRGQEGDPWKGEVENPSIPELSKAQLLKPGYSKPRQDWVNRQYLKNVEDLPQTKTFDQGIEFIRKNSQADKWFLQIENFDPHEPFFAPEKFRKLYEHDYKGGLYDWPNYGKVEESEEEIEHIRKEYAALVSMCDENLGRFLDTMDELDLWKDTMLIVCTDHGYSLGDHGWWAKNVMPWYNMTAHTPLFIWDPRCERKNEHSSCLVQFIDFVPTILEYFGLQPTADMLGKSLKDTIAFDKPVHDYVLFGIYGVQVNITDGHYVYMRGPATPENQPLYEYTLMPAHLGKTFDVSELQDMSLAGPFSFTKGCKLIKVPGSPQNQADTRKYNFKTELFDIKNDYDQMKPIKDPEMEERMIKSLISLMKENDAPLDQYERLGLLKYIND